MDRRVGDLLLVGTVLLWALNVTASKYILDHGVHPLAYASVRYALAGLLFVAVTVPWERTLAIAPDDLPLVGLSVVLLFVNQIGFVYALRFTTAATTALIFGTLPIFTALIQSALRAERLSRRFWLASVVSFAGVALVAAGERGGLSGNVKGDALAVMSTAAWGGYSVVIAALMSRYSPFRLSAVVLIAFALATGAVGAAQLGDQSLALGALVWAALAFAVIGPLFLTNVTWFTALHAVGPARATLFANLQPFFAALAAVVLLSEQIRAIQIAGALAIAAGIVVARRKAGSPVRE
jgi:drug/metabolite transporter (DMT)-like permease